MQQCSPFFYSRKAMRLREQLVIEIDGRPHGSLLWYASNIHHLMPETMAEWDNIRHRTGGL
jgi:hypothetical protein